MGNRLKPVIRNRLLISDQHVHHLIGLRKAGADLRRAIDSLHQGVPEDARKLQDDPETWEWLEARHWITFVADHDRRWILVTDLESATVE